MIEIRFKDAGHREFYMAQADRCRTWDAYHKALMYTLGLSEDCRRHIGDVFDYKQDTICPDCLNAGWQTSGSRRAILMAYNLYNGYMAAEPGESSPYSLFCDSNAPFFFEGIRLRYPEYTETTLYSVQDSGGHVVQDGLTNKIIADSYCTLFARNHGGEYTAVEQAKITALV